VLKISRTDFERLRRHGEETYPHECCGVLLGKIEDGVRNVLSTAPCLNTDAASDWFNIDPRQIVRIQREAAARGEDILGFYHSHPDDAARWSASDLREAHWLGCSYVITSVRAGKSAETNSFLLAGATEEDKHFEDEPIELDT
jgi:proteasome lid subunit RPN8/RPN11